MSALLTAALIAVPVALVLLGGLAAWIGYRLGFGDGQQAYRARHALARLEQAQQARMVRHA